MEKRKVLYERIREIQKNQNLTVTKIAEMTGICKQTVSHRILRIKKTGTIDIEFIEKLEEISGQEIIKI
ncbi:MAG: winged helix-turn-helix transcriptional regulator [Cetobacterium sp.]